MKSQRKPTMSVGEKGCFSAASAASGPEEIWAVHLPASGYEPSGGPELELYADDFIAGVTEGDMAYWIPVL
jgi:predicted transcriptional regulator YdeE